MAEKLKYIEELSEKTLKKLSTKNNWISYLQTASNHYKYSFRDSCLIYAQRPDAKAVASYDLWNNRMHRFVNRGANGIALIDVNSKSTRLHYVFDISDTNGQRMPFIWQYKKEFNNQIVDDMKDSFSIESKAQDLESIIADITDSLLTDNIPDLLDELKYSVHGSFLDGVDELNIKLWYEETLRESIVATTLFRCGYELNFDDYELSQLYNFNTPETIVKLGKAVSDMSETILREIELSVKKIEREQRNNERSKQDGLEIQRSGGRNDVSRTENQGTDRRAVDEIRDDAERISEETSRRQVRHDGLDGNAVPPLQGSRDADENTDEHEDRTDEKDHTEEFLADENSRDRERADEGAYTDKISEQNYIDTVLLNGNGIEGGKQRIIDFFYANSENNERANFLESEYGNGGHSVTFGKISGFVNYGSNGITISNQGYKRKPIKLTWAQAVKRIDELRDNERYFKQRQPNDKPLIKPTIDENIETLGADKAPFFIEKSEEEQIGQSVPKKRRTQSEMNFVRLEKIVPHIIDKRYRYAKFKSDGFMDLTIEWVGNNRISLAHYGEQNGDLMADPDMEIIIDFDKKQAMPATYQNDYMGVFQKVYYGNNKWIPKLSRQLTSFLSTWLKNIEYQGHVIDEAVYFDDDLAINPIVFDEKGQEYGFDISHDLFSATRLEEKKAEQSNKMLGTLGYKLGYGELGNGITVWNELDKADGDYENIAHISDEGNITYYRKDLPTIVINQIKNKAHIQLNKQPPPKEEVSAENTFLLPQEDIDQILRSGSNKEDSTLRICIMYRLGKSDKENIDFLRNEYSNGRGYYLNNEKVSVWFHGDGIHIAKGDTVLNSDAKQIITWEQVEKRISELLEQGQYITQSELDTTDLYERTQLAQSFWYMHKDMADEIREQYFDKELFQGGFPDSTKRIAELFKSSKKLSGITEELERFAKAYEKNHDLMRFHLYNPVEVLERFRDLQLPHKNYTSELDDITHPEMFITQDEIDNLFASRGSGVEHGKYRIYSFFLNNDDNKERIRFLKKEYGTGGFSHTGYSENHDSKGITFSREYNGKVYDKVKLTWSKVSKRIDELIETERYMSPKELEYIPEYERRHIAVQIYYFYYRRPLEITRPYDYADEIKKAIGNISKQLENTESVSSLLNHMSEVMDSTDDSDRDYEIMRKAYATMQEYVNGTFTLFGEKRQQLIEAENKTLSVPDEENSQPEKANHDKWDDFIIIEDEEALKRFDNDEGIYLLYDDGTEALAENEKRLIQHINSGGLVGLEKEIEFYENLNIQEDDSIIIDNGQYVPLLESIIKQGNMTQKGKSNISTFIKNTSDFEMILEKLPSFFEEFWSEAEYDGEKIKWHISTNGLEVYINGFDGSKLYYTWDKIARRTIRLCNNDEYLEDENLDMGNGAEEAPFLLDDIEHESIITESKATVIWSEHLEIEDGSVYTLPELNARLLELDKEIQSSPEGNQKKTRIIIDYPINGVNQTYDFRYDIGFGYGGIDKRIKLYWENVKNDSELAKQFGITENDISEALEKLVPYIEQAINQDRAPTSRLYEGMTVSLNDRAYTVETLDVLNNKIKLRDISFAQGTGFPIFRQEDLRSFEQELQHDGFFDRLKKEENISPVEQNKINYHISDDNLGVGGAKEKYKRNIEAIKLLKTIESEDRLATEDEQEILSQYVGWGGLAKAFDETDSSWSSEYAELKSLLDEDEYKAARSSTLNAHFTTPVVIKAIYNALDNMGFKGGNILEPAMGVGNFMGLLPPSFSNSKMYGVELDSISGRIAKQLYQRENIQVAGFENTAFHDNFFDVVIGNVPFGAYGVVDRKYNKHNFQIHDYFFAKALDKVRPGGVIAFITSKGTLDKKNSSVRKYLAQRAELVGAIRLPNNTFKANAGTEVTSDIIFLKKRDSIQDIEPDWVQLGKTWDGLLINQYFANNPHMLLGKMVKQIGMYGTEEIACIPFDNKELEQQLDEAIAHVQAEIDENEYMIDEPDVKDTSIPADPNVKNYSFTIVEDKLYYRENSRMNLYEANATAEKRIRAMIALSNTLHNLIDYQIEGYGDYEIRKMQSRLNNQYDEFAKGFGRINDRANRRAFSDDSAYYLLSSLENLDDDGNFESKADIFTKQTIRPRKTITHVDTSAEALAVSIGNRAQVDIGYMSALTGKDSAIIINDLKGVIFKDPLSDLDNPYDGYLISDEYLSGNVRDKLRTAKTVAENHPEFAHHVSVLEAVQPEDIEAADIAVKLGTVWIPLKYIEEFMYEYLDTRYSNRYKINVSYSNYSGSWNISNKSMEGQRIEACETYGTQRINAYQIIEETLNQKTVRITDKIVNADGKEEYVLNKKETFLAIQKQNLIKEEFKDWIFRDEQRRKYLVDYYNEHFNNIRPREYNGEHLVFEGMNPSIELREHQRNAVARQLYGGNSLLAHVVGSGKTFTMIAAAMESKRLGLSTKSMIAVPNHLTEQIASETLRLYPSAKVLVTTKKDFQKNNRKRFCSKISTGDYDIVIIGHSQFEKIPISIERQIRTLKKEIDNISYSVAQERRYGTASFNIKQMERTKKTLVIKLTRLNNQSRKDDVVTFEELGIDRLLVDEAHSFKNLFVYTKMRNVAGIQQTQAQKSMDMYMKCQYMDEITGGKGITFATGTPVSNSMVELYTMQRYLQLHELRKRDLIHFDNWASVFGETQTAYELAPEGERFRMKTRFSRFYNLPELMAMFKEIADIQTNDMLNLPIPKLKGGEIQNITVKATPIQRKMIFELGKRADAVRKGDVEPTEDNMLKITNDGRKIALDQRLANICLPDDPESKVNSLMNNVYAVWAREVETKGAQIVFCDLSTPKFDGSFNVYEDLKKKWIEKGIPEEQIAFIHEAKNEKDKAMMFAKVRSGEIRIILGSTFKMGSGVNIQDRLKAVHHADVGWKPSSMEQRNGRILRQGNMYDEVEIYRYITENTFDSYSWQLLEQKQRFISQIMTSKTPLRSADDIDEAVLSYAEVKALATGNPKIKERMELDLEVGKLKILKAAHRNKIYRLQDQISTRLPSKLKAIEQRINGYEADIKTAASFLNKDFEMTLKGTSYTDKKYAGEMILVIAKTAYESNGKTIGRYKGFDMTINSASFFKTEPYIELKGEITHRVYLGDDAHGNITRLDNVIKGFNEQLTHFQQESDAMNVQLENAKKEVNKPFDSEFDLKQKAARLAELNHELSLDKKDEAMEIDENEQEEKKTATVGIER